MARIVTARKRTHGAAQTGNAGERTVKAASIAVVVVCAALAAWRLLAPADGGAPSPHAPQKADAARLEGGGRSPGAPQNETKNPSPGGAPGGRSRPSARQSESDASPSDGAPGDGFPPSAPQNGEASVAADSSAPQPTPSGNRERKFFDNDVENTLATVSEPGAEFFGFPPMDPDMEDSEIIALLKRPVVIEEDDDEATIAAKERTAEFKTKALEAMENGLTFAQFVRDTVALRNEQAAMREDARSEMLKILRNDGEPAAREYLKIVNKELSAQGMKELDIPPYILEDYRQKR